MKNKIAWPALAAFLLGPCLLAAAEEPRAASISGSIKFVGTLPKPKLMAINKDQDVCGKGRREIVEVRVNKKGLLEEAVVYLDGKYDVAAWKPAERKYSLVQEGCKFLPYISVVPKNVELLIDSRDPVLHNIHQYELIGRARLDLFNVSQPKESKIKQQFKTKKSNFVQVQCDAHDFMSAWIFAADNPYYAVAADGTYTISDAPPGKHKLKVWHPIMGTKESMVEVTAGRKLTVDFTFEKK